MHGSETISSLEQKIWDILPTELKGIVSPTLLKTKKKKNNKFVHEPQRIIHVVYIKHMYKILDLF